MLRKWFEVIRLCEIPLHRFLTIFLFVIITLALDLITLSSIPLFFSEESILPFSLSLNNLSDDKITIFGVILISFMFRTLFSFLFQIIIIKFGVDLQLVLRERILQKTLEMDIYRSDRGNPSSNFIFGLQVVPTSIANLLIQFFQASGEALVGIGLIVFIASISSNLFISFFFGFAIIGSFYLVFFRKITKEAGKIENEMVSNMLLQLKEVHSGLQEIGQFKAQRFFFVRLQKTFKRLAESLLTIRVISSGTRYVLELGFVLILILFFIVFEEFKTDETLFIQLGIFTVAGYRLVPGFRSVIAMYVQLNNHQNTADRFLLLMKPHSTISQSPPFVGDEDSTEISFESLELKGISYCYAQDEDIFRNLNLHIKKGDFVAIIGPSGSGKTTLLDIIAGYISPKTGVIYLNDEIIDPNLFKDIFSYMPQDAFVFTGSVEENICLTNNSNSIDNHLRDNAINLAKLDFLGVQNEGLTDILDENGQNFSGGQIQRICLARAVYFGKQVLIIDEGTSNLDRENRKKIYDALAALTKGGSTVIMVTHDSEVLGYCSQAVDLGNVSDVDN